MNCRLTILGCGSSAGVPRIGNIWGACDPDNPKNRRRRCSALVELDGDDGTTRVLIDTSPDLRDQMLDVGISSLDGVLYTGEQAIEGSADVIDWCLSQSIPHLFLTKIVYTDAMILVNSTKRFIFDSRDFISKMIGHQTRRIHVGVMEIIYP